MDLTQIVLGTALLAVSSLTLVGPSVLELSLPGYVLPGTALVVGALALFVGVAKESRA
ncbi:hypothetical protein [Halopiger djelfimassiliensis]|uniref:hypothetical protein n=1 Tax=Halopiger djelfimassiliensis TaxID=1293047 RepID=UPI000AE8EA65|nr:hypothetical protein [Halopiger djelfimassiliensis]